jgi:hypothetical protein
MLTKPNKDDVCCPCDSATFRSVVIGREINGTADDAASASHRRPYAFVSSAQCHEEIDRVIVTKVESSIFCLWVRQHRRSFANV